MVYHAENNKCYFSYMNTFYAKFLYELVTTFLQKGGVSVVILYYIILYEIVLLLLLFKYL